MKTAAAVLIVDDNPDEAALLQAACAEYCPEAGFVLAVDCAAAWDALRRTPGIALALIDFHLGEETSERLLLQIRTDPAYAQLGVVVYSTELAPEERELLRRASLAWERKPADFPAYLELAKRVCAVLDDAGAQPQGAP